MLLLNAIDELGNPATLINFVDLWLEIFHTRVFLFELLIAPLVFTLRTTMADD